MRFSQRLSFPIVLLLLVAMGAYAQSGGTNGVIFGTVTTEGKPLPGVTVTVSSPALQGTRTVVTGDGGGYTVPALPPGIYTVQMALEGMTPITRKVTLTLAQQARADADMRVGAVAESITVTASAPAVLETTQVGMNFNQETISKLPVARNIRQTVLLAPGVNPNGVNQQITISGAPSYENTFMVNGVVVNENLRGQPHNLFIEDAIQETTVMTAGISAEYGRFTGGVVSTLTKSGGNEFSGSLRDSLTNPSWTETPDFVNPTTGVRTTDPPDITNQVYEATLGGRIIRDRLWFFGAARKAKTSAARSTFGTNLAFTNGFDEKRYEGKLTGQITPRHNVVLSYLDITNTESNNFLAPIYDFASIVPSRQLPNTLATVNYNAILTNNLLAEAAWSRKEFSFIGSGGRLTDRIGGTWIQDSVSTGRFNAPVFCGVCGDEERNSGSIGAKATYFLSTRNMGNHNIVFGADTFNEERISNNYQSASNFTMVARAIQVGTDVFPRIDSTSTLTYRPILVLSPGTDLKSNSYFVNDRWDLNSRLSFNVGLRFDTNNAVDADGNTVSDDSNFSPRMGMLWDVRGDGRHRVTASLARYVAKITDGSNVTSTAQAAGNPAAFTYAYGGPAINPVGTPNASLLTTAQALAIVFQWFESIGGVNSTAYQSSTYPGFSSRFPESLKSPAADEISLGYGMQVGRNAFFKIDAVHREWHNFYAAEMADPTRKITPPNGVVADLLWTVNDDEFTERDYDALEFQGSWSRNRLNVGGNYTWSKLQGNDVPEGAGTATIRNTPGELFYPQFLAYDQLRPVGYLGQDRRHRARMWVGYDLGTPIGNFNISLLESYDSGFAYSAIGSIDATGRNANFNYAGRAANPGYILNGTGTLHDYYFSDRGEFRTDDRLATDLALNYSLPLWGKFEFFFRGDLLNVFNVETIVDPSLINTDVITSRTGGAASGLRAFNPFTDTPIECPQGNTAAQCTALGAHWQKGPTFGQASSADALQIADRSLAPRTYRFSLGLRF